MEFEGLTLQLRTETVVSEGLIKRELEFCVKAEASLLIRVIDKRPIRKEAGVSLSGSTKPIPVILK